MPGIVRTSGDSPSPAAIGLLADLVDGFLTVFFALLRCAIVGSLAGGRRAAEVRRVEFDPAIRELLR
jgi:hypothetical protein